MSGAPKTPYSDLLASRRNFLGGALATGVGATVTLRSSNALGRYDTALSAPHDLLWGVNGHPVTAYPGISLPEQFELVKALGFTHYRVNLRGDGSVSYLDEILKVASAWGVSIIPILQPDTSLKDTNAKTLKTRAFGLAKYMARKFRGRVPIWELGNELENFAIIQPCEQRDDGTKYPCEWGPAGGVGPLEYYGPRWRKVSAVLSGFSEGVAAADPKAIRAMGTAGFGHLGAFERMKQDKIEWDITVWHDYETIRESYLETLAEYGKPIWITEFNAGGGGDQSHEQNAKMLTERIAFYREVRDKYKVAAAFVYELLDEPYWGDHFEARMGLVSLIPDDKRGWRVGAIKPQGLAVQRALNRGS